jgi:hypothetical protein
MADLTPTQINDLNLHMRQQPWYQTWFQKQGLDPNQVKLSDSQRSALAQEAARNGMPLPPHMIIDPAGNTNTQHGFAGQPTWLKILEVAAPVAATAGFGAAGIGPMAGMMGAGGGAGAAGAAAMPEVTGSLAGAALPAAEGTGAALAGGTGATLAGMTGGPVVAGGIPTISGLGAGATGLTSGMAASTPAVTGMSGVTGTGGALSGLLGDHKDIAGGLSDLGKTIGSATSAAASNRGLAGEFQQKYDQLMLDAQANQRTNESDAMRKLAQTDYINQGGSHYNPASPFSIGGKSYDNTDLGFGPTPIGPGQSEGAQTLQSQLLKRLQPGGSYTPTNPSTFTKPGTGETIGNWVGPAISGLGAASKIFGT